MLFAASFSISPLIVYSFDSLRIFVTGLHGSWVSRSFYTGWIWWSIPRWCFPAPLRPAQCQPIPVTGFHPFHLSYIFSASFLDVDLSSIFGLLVNFLGVSESIITFFLVCRVWWILSTPNPLPTTIHSQWTCSSHSSSHSRARAPKIRNFITTVEG